ncbi:MAG TPA: histidinol phosphate phosphatase domain-containing protein, partial [Thermodesulfatator sp.]|nr:histidinol phosphate phosphatase domain-containing protein [Thermodesulfatator sp.]
THVAPELISSLVARARELGARVVVVHGETIVEPVAPGTNRAGILAGADILAHPGLISEEDVRLAAEKGVFLELSGRRGHCLTNGHVAALAKQLGASLIVNSDGHAPDDFLSPERARQVALGAGLREEEVSRLFSQARDHFLISG